MNTRAKEFYEFSRGLSAFNMPKDARKVGANQYGVRYMFTDGSYLRIDKQRNVIEWRANTPRNGSHGAIRSLFGNR